MSPPVAVIDIGSNSIKLLVAARDAAGGITALHTRTIEARISQGISQAEPQLGEEAMARGLDAIQSLLADARLHTPDQTLLVATSAVRDAKNGAEFRQRVEAATGHAIRILSGAEEAQLIGRGLTCDPALQHLRDFYVFDLGGGSLECLAFKDRKLDQAASLQLGAVRLMEQFVSDPAKPMLRVRHRIMMHVQEELVRGPFRFSFPVGAVAVGTGGTVATARAILGAAQGKSFAESDPLVRVTQLRLLFTRLARMTLEERRQVPGLPAGRADIMPTALVTLVVLANISAIEGYRHSAYNLRYGLAADALGAQF